MPLRDLAIVQFHDAISIRHRRNYILFLISLLFLIFFSLADKNGRENYDKVGFGSGREVLINNHQATLSHISLATSSTPHHEKKD